MFVEHAIAEADGARSTPEDVDQFWRNYLASGERCNNHAAFADILEVTNWLPRELQDSLLRLLKSGEIVNLDSTGKTRPKRPLHYDGAGERLRLKAAG